MGRQEQHPYHYPHGLTPMTIEEFARLVDRLRHAQKEFFRTRSDSALEDAKALERRVDEAIENILNSQQKTLFD